MAHALMTRFAVSMLPAFYELSGKKEKNGFLNYFGTKQPLIKMAFLNIHALTNKLKEIK